MLVFDKQTQETYYHICGNNSRRKKGDVYLHDVHAYLLLEGKGGEPIHYPIKYCPHCAVCVEQDERE